jgi:hypothetical protein
MEACTSYDIGSGNGTYGASTNDILLAEKIRDGLNGMRWTPFKRDTTILYRHAISAKMRRMWSGRLGDLGLQTQGFRCFVAMFCCTCLCEYSHLRIYQFMLCRKISNN